jgi:hypothetical protein
LLKRNVNPFSIEETTLSYRGKSKGNYGNNRHANHYSHWRTPKLTVELESAKSLLSGTTSEHYPRASKSLIALERSRYEEIISQIEGTLSNRKK